MCIKCQDVCSVIYNRRCSHCWGGLKCHWVLGTGSNRRCSLSVYCSGLKCQNTLVTVSNIDGFTYRDPPLGSCFSTETPHWGAASGKTHCPSVQENWLVLITQWSETDREEPVYYSNHLYWSHCQLQHTNITVQYE